MSSKIEVPAIPKAFAVWFKDLDRWSVDSYVSIGWRWPKNMIRPLSEVLHRKSIEVDRKTTKSDAIKLVTLHFDGEIEPRKLDEKKTIKGKLTWADPGDVIYSQIDVRNGAIGIIPDNLGRVCVTTEYPVYEVDKSIVDARYIKLLFRTTLFRRKINSMISGTSGRKRVQPLDLEMIEIPIPPLKTQLSIISEWEKAQNETKCFLNEIGRIENQIETDFLADLGLLKQKRVAPVKVFGVWWKDLERWSVMFNQLASSSIDVTNGENNVVTLGDVSTVSYGIQKCPSNRPGQHARPYLRVANVQRGELDLREVKTINVPDADMPTYRLEPGDLLVCEGNSADLVGRPAIWHGEIPDCVHQNHILKVRVNRSIANPEFILEYMQTTPARNYFRSRAKFTTNLASINSNDLRDLPLPLPPLDTQNNIVANVAARRKKIADLKIDVEKKVQQAKVDVEVMILGEKNVGEA